MNNAELKHTYRNAVLPVFILLMVAFLWACSGDVQAQVLSRDVLSAHRFSENAVLVKGPDANVLVIESSEGLVLVDGGHASWSAALHEVVEEYFPGKTIRALINTQWHPEQTGSNVSLGLQGVEIIAHENTMLWLSTEVWQRWSDKHYSALQPEGLPTTIFFDDGVLNFGELTVQYGNAWNSHTDGDIWVYIEQENILVTGGLVSNGFWPEIDWSTGGYIGGMLNGFVSLLSIPNEQTKIIPSFGDVMNLEQLHAQNRMYLTIFDRIHASFIKSNSLQDMLALNLAEEYEGEMGDSTLFMTLAIQSLRGRLRDPQNFRLINLP